MSSTFTAEIAATAARLVVEEGMEYGPAKRRAAKVLGKQSARTAELPSNDEVEDEVRAYLDLFCADSQPAELAALREIAVRWMERLAEFRPHLTGATSPWVPGVRDVGAVGYHQELHRHEPFGVRFSVSSPRWQPTAAC